MKAIIDYSFDDEIIKKFCFSIINKKIEVYFYGYFDLNNNKYIEGSCKWTITNWTKAKSKLCRETKYNSLTEQLGIFSMILSIEYDSQNLKITVNTVDNRYIDLIFENAIIELE